MTVLTAEQIETLDARYPNWRSMNAVNRMALAARVQGTTPAANADRAAVIRQQSELAALEKRLARIEASPIPALANAKAFRDQTVARLQDRIAGLRRAVEAAP